MILFAIFLYFTGIFGDIILILTYPFLEGSSQGKYLILFSVIGILLLFYPLFNQNGAIANKISKNLPQLSFEGQKYLKITILIMFITYLVGLSLEMWLRAKFGVSPFTIFVSFGQQASTTSLTHSHILKSIFGSFIGFLGIQVPSDINTGLPLAQYLSPVAYIIFFAFPLVLITGLISLNGRSDLYKIILSFGITVSIIGMLDGGLFSTPALFGLLILLSVYYLKKPFSPKYLLKIQRILRIEENVVFRALKSKILNLHDFLLCKLTTPFTIVLILVLLRLSVGIIGTTTDYHEITIINPSDDINLTSYNVLSIEKNGNKMIVKVPGNTNDKVLLLRLMEDLNGKCTGFFLSWNIYSWT